MKTQEASIAKGQYLSDIIKQIPSNCILSKTLPGIGATTLELDTERDSIIVVPNVPVIKSKCEKYPNLLGVFEGVTKEDVRHYIATQKGFLKLMTTPESFVKIKKACKELQINIYDIFFLLLDECHTLIEDVNYRADIVLPMADFFKFKQKAMVSATPIGFSAPNFELQGFEILQVNPSFDYHNDIWLIKTNNIFQTIKKFLKEDPVKLWLPNHERSNSFFFFINSISMIRGLIRQLGIERESSIFCADKSYVKLKGEFGFDNAYNEWDKDNARKYNFFTARFFNAFDLELDFKPEVILVSDIYSAPQTMFDIDTDCVQISGRFRNGINCLTHIYNSPEIVGTYYHPTPEIVKKEIDAHEVVYKAVKTLYENAATEEERRAFGAALETLPFRKYLYDSGSKNYFAIDNAISEAKYKAKYRFAYQIEGAYSQNPYFKALPLYDEYYPLADVEKLKLERSSKSVKIKRTQIVEILSSFKRPYSEEEQDTIYQIREIDPLIVEAFDLLGPDKIEELNYSEKKIREALILAERKGNKTIRLIKNSFQIGQKYTNTFIKEELLRIFKEVGILPERTPKGSMIKDYFEAVPVNKIKGERGYLITGEKF